VRRGGLRCGQLCEEIRRAPLHLVSARQHPRVEFSSLSSQPLQPFEEQIKEDGTITLPYVSEVQAAGKTTGELQKILQKAYERYFNNLTITVKAPDRYYSVGGEVKLPNRYLYVSGTTVIKAIHSAGDLTEFANRKKIILTRANGKTQRLNYNKLLENPREDLPVYAGDSIHVPQRRF
jgi:polysaccharide export outer membrane protein